MNRLLFSKCILHFHIATERNVYDCMLIVF